MNIDIVKKYLNNPIISLFVSVSITGLIIYVYKNLDKILFNINIYKINHSNSKIINNIHKIIVI
jgi:hypothetical protein